MNVLTRVWVGVGDGDPTTDPLKVPRVRVRVRDRVTVRDPVTAWPAPLNVIKRVSVQLPVAVMVALAERVTRSEAVGLAVRANSVCVRVRLLSALKDRVLHERDAVTDGESDSVRDHERVPVTLLEPVSSAVTVRLGVAVRVRVNASEKLDVSEDATVRLRSLLGLRVTMDAASERSTIDSTVTIAAAALVQEK